MECKKMNGMGQRSWPDRCFFIPGGRPFLIEFKSPGEEPTVKQAFTIAKLLRQKYDVEVYDDPTRAIEAITTRVNAARATDNEASGKVDTAKISKVGSEARCPKDVCRLVTRSRTR
jgi:hypothetical protein